MTTAAIYDFNTKKQIGQKSLTHADCMQAMGHAVAPDYMSGCASGSAAALAYLKYVASENYFSGGTLQHIFFVFARELSEAASEPEIDAIRGKIVGLFTSLEVWLRFAAQTGTSEALRDANWETIQAALQDAAHGGPKKRYEDKQKAIRSEKSRLAATARWSKRKTIEA